MEDLTKDIAKVSIHEVSENPLIEEFDALMDVPGMRVEGKAWRRRRRNFFFNEIQDILHAADDGEGVARLVKQFSLLIHQRGTQQDQLDFSKRTDIFEDVPRVPKKRNNKRKGGRSEAKRNQMVNTAIIDFRTYMGRGQLADWQNMCEDLRMPVIPTTITLCKKSIQLINVNIFDFLAFKKGAKHFASVAELANYSRNSNKILPRERAKELGPIGKLLRLIG